MPAGAFFRINISHTSMDLIKYLKETKAELKEVVFPTLSQTTMYTTAVVVLSVIVALVLSGVDFGLREGLAKLLAR
jgi:preprotein translocase SecE subunit